MPSRARDRPQRRAVCDPPLTGQAVQRPPNVLMRPYQWRQIRAALHQCRNRASTGGACAVLYPPRTSRRSLRPAVFQLPLLLRKHLSVQVVWSRCSPDPGGPSRRVVYAGTAGRLVALNAFAPPGIKLPEQGGGPGQSIHRATDPLSGTVDRGWLKYGSSADAGARCQQRHFQHATMRTYRHRLTRHQRSI